MVRISNLYLLRALKENSRIPFVKLAEKFGVSETAIRKRVRKLEREGIIKRYTIEVDPRKLGFEISALIGLDTTPEKYIYVLEVLKKRQEVVALYSSSGDHMITAECWFKKSSAMVRFVKWLEQTSGVVKVCPALILERLK